jgi:hypothetical protein
VLIDTDCTVFGLNFFPLTCPKAKFRKNVYLSKHSTGQWFSLGTLVFSTSKTDHHDITEKLLKVALNKTHIIKTRTFSFKVWVNSIRNVVQYGIIPSGMW